MCGSLLTALLVSISLSAIDNSLCVGNLMFCHLFFLFFLFSNKLFHLLEKVSSPHERVNHVLTTISSI